MDEPILNWVSEDDHDLALSGAVLAGKRVRLQASWPTYGTYTGPEKFIIRSAPARFIPGGHVTSLPAANEGPPITHSALAWKTGRLKRFGQQRYYFTEAHKARSPVLVVSNLEHYTTEPKVRVQAEVRARMPLGPEGKVAAEAGYGATKYNVGATQDPAVRVTIMTNRDPNPRNDLWPYIQPLIVSKGGTDIDADEYLKNRFLGAEASDQWQPVFENGERETVFEVDENHSEEVTIIPERQYRERFRPFMTAFAIRVEDVENPERFVISDVVTVEGGFHGSRLELGYPQGSVLFRTV